jgi:hypothetical protein
VTNKQPCDRTLKRQAVGKMSSSGKRPRSPSSSELSARIGRSPPSDRSKISSDTPHPPFSSRHRGAPYCSLEKSEKRGRRKPRRKNAVRPSPNYPLPPPFRRDCRGRERVRVREMAAPRFFFCCRSVYFEYVRCPRVRSSRRTNYRRLKTRDGTWGNVKGQRSLVV